MVWACSDRRSCRPVPERSTHDRHRLLDKVDAPACCRLLPVLLGALALLGAATPARAAPYELAIATGGVTGIYYQFGAAICRLLRDHPPARPIDCVTQGSGGSVANLQNLREGRVPLALAQSDSTFDAATGAGGFARQGADPKLRALFSPLTEAFMVLTRIRRLGTELGGPAGAAPEHRRPGLGLGGHLPRAAGRARLVDQRLRASDRAQDLAAGHGTVQRAGGCDLVRRRQSRSRSCRRRLSPAGRGSCRSTRSSPAR